MSSDLQTIKRCEHIKVNGTQCNSPALRDTKFCYFHIQYHCPEMETQQKQWRVTHLPTLDDAHSIQVELAKVMQRLLWGEVDHQEAVLIIRALEMASTNLQRMSPKQKLRPQPVMDRPSVANRPFDASAWSRIEGREYDDLTEDDPTETDNRKQPKNPKRVQ